MVREKFHGGDLAFSLWCLHFRLQYVSITQTTVVFWLCFSILYECNSLTSCYPLKISTEEYSYGILPYVVEMCRVSSKHRYMSLFVAWVLFVFMVGGLEPSTVSWSSCILRYPTEKRCLWEHVSRFAFRWCIPLILMLLWLSFLSLRMMCKSTGSKLLSSCSWTPSWPKQKAQALLRGALSLSHLYHFQCCEILGFSKPWGDGSCELLLLELLSTSSRLCRRIHTINKPGYEATFFRKGYLILWWSI